MAWRNKLIWILTGLCFIALVYLSYSYGRSNPSQKILNSYVEKYESLIVEKDKTIKEKEEALKESESNYKDLVLKIKKKALEAKNVKPPKTAEETKKRFTDLGFPPSK